MPDHTLNVVPYDGDDDDDIGVYAFQVAEHDRFLCMSLVTDRKSSSHVLNRPLTICAHNVVREAMTAANAFSTMGISADATADRHLSGCSTSAMRLYALFTSASVAVGRTPKTRRLTVSPPMEITAMIRRASRSVLSTLFSNGDTVGGHLLAMVLCCCRCRVVGVTGEVAVVVVFFLSFLVTRSTEDWWGRGGNVVLVLCAYVCACASCVALFF